MCSVFSYISPPYVSFFFSISSLRLLFRVGLPHTPKGKEKSHFKFFCPICYLYFRDIYKSKCCNNYICNACSLSHYHARVTTAIKLVRTPTDRPMRIPCPNCNTENVTFTKVALNEVPRCYQESPNTKNLIAHQVRDLTKPPKGEMLLPIKSVLVFEEDAEEDSSAAVLAPGQPDDGNEDAQVTETTNTTSRATPSQRRAAHSRAASLTDSPDGPRTGASTPAGSPVSDLPDAASEHTEARTESERGRRFDSRDFVLTSRTDGLMHPNDITTTTTDPSGSLPVAPRIESSADEGEEEDDSDLSPLTPAPRRIQQDGVFSSIVPGGSPS